MMPILLLDVMLVAKIG